jgi:hypothetical protein
MNLLLSGVLVNKMGVLLSFISHFTLFSECSFNITDDKSVSRRHASITFPPSLILPLLSDCNSKFGTFVNEDRVVSPVQLKHGDTVKFGGASSEFVVEAKDFSVYVKSQRTKRFFKVLKEKFGVDIVSSLQEAAYFVLDDDEEINEVDPDLISAFLSCKLIVSPSYFSQLLQSNTISLGLIQPSITSKLFPVDCWLPRKERLNLLRNAFEGIRRLVMLEGDKNEKVLKTIGSHLEIETNSTQSYELRDLKFNELFIVSSLYPDVKDLKDPIRTVKYQSLIEAVIRCDGKLIEVSTVYPEKAKELERERGDMLLNYGSKERGMLADEPQTIQIVDDMPSSSIEQATYLKVSAPASFSQEIDYNGPSLTAVFPMPASLLRPAQFQSQAPSDSSEKKPKFVKCHPRHRLPGSIPALFGPDQLQPCRPMTVNGDGVQSSKRRVLVKDSWLAEEDLVEEEEGLDVKMVKENRQQRSNVPTKTTITEQSTVNKLNPMNISDQTTKIVETPLPPTNPAVPPAPQATNSKFQSSFFKNLSKGK